MALCWFGVALAGVGWLRSTNQEPSSPAPPHRALINRYCVTCHNEKLRTAELLLDKVDAEKVGEGAAVWEKVVRKLRTGAMPPVGMPRPDKTTYDSFATYLETELDRAAAAKPNPGRPVVHRLNRSEYTNAIRDLLALDIDAGSLLPADNSNYGFDNIGDALSVSPMLMERYISAAGKISRLAVGDPAIRPVTETYPVPQLLVQDTRVSEYLPFGSRGGIAVRHYFPIDGEYVVKILLQRNPTTLAIIGLADPHQIDVRLDGVRIKLFTVGGQYKGTRENLYPQTKTNFEYLSTADAPLEVRIPVQAGTHGVGVTFLKEPKEKFEALLHPEQAGFHFVQPDDHDLPYVDSVTIGGPYDGKSGGETPSRRKIFICNPSNKSDEQPCAKKILSILAHQAYRRPVTNGDLQALLSLYQEGESNGGFEAGIERALRAMLVCPDFLFRSEHDPENVRPNTAYRISDLELASRLSFFLWSSIPDEQLLEVAASGMMKDPRVLEAQVHRMLVDPRSSALVSNFGGQWLYLRNLREISPDLNSFPNFDDSLREAFQQETELFFQSIVREDRGVVDFLNADYTFVNERLARHYGIPNIYGSQFRRVPLSDENRRGLLGQGSILTVTSFGNRTSPVVRGKWVLDNFLGTPPPPPPPNVPALKEKGPDDGRVLTMRQRMEEHRGNPVCASCHKLMDPIGFALENFDGLGKWRAADGNNPIDSSGQLPDGAKFQGPAGLRQALLGKSDQFVSTLTEKLLMYALGRGVEYYDAPAVRKILREAALSNYRWSSLVIGIVNSTPFQMRRSQEPAVTAGLR
jgi:hypothetical protein